MPEQAPAAPPASDKAATVAPQQTSGAPPVSSIDDVYGEFDTIESSQPPTKTAQKKESAPDPKPASSADKVSPKTGSESSTEPEEEKDSSPPSVESTSKTQEPKPVKAAELRNAYENLKREHHRLKADFEQVKKSSTDTTRIKQLEELLDSERKARHDAEQELKFTAYEKSAEFKDKFQKPYIQAYSLGRQKAASLKVIEQKNDVDEVTRPARQGTEADFDAIMRIEDDDAAAEKAIDLFGQKAQAVLYYRERVQELHNSSRSAIEEYRTNSDKREKEQTEARTRQEQEQQERVKANAELFRKYVDEGQKAHPDLFAPIDGDDQSPEIVKRGQLVADSLFTGINPKTGRPYTPDGQVRFHAFVRNAVAAHGNILYRLKAAQTKIAELESDLKEYKTSGSSQDSGRGEAPPKQGLPGDEEFDALESKSTRRW